MNISPDISSAHFSVEKILSTLGVSVTRLASDSRAVRSGDTFLAYPGAQADGRKFIAQAIQNGANAVIWEAQNFVWNEDSHIPNLAINNLRQHVGEIASYIYGAPSSKLWMIGITGTNGKTSCAHWIAQVLQALPQSAHCPLVGHGKKTVLIGTLGNGFVGALQPTLNTTPDAVLLHQLLTKYLADGAQAVSMEVSSHALQQGRVNGVKFNVALLTNLSHDHLDYHSNMRNYAAAKARLFEWPQLKYAVLNLDDDFGADLVELMRDKDAEIIGYGLTDAALEMAERLGLRMVYGGTLQMNAQGLSVQVHSSWGSGTLHSALLGRFNASNLLGVLAVLLVSDIALHDALRELSKVKAVAGRMQTLGGNKLPTVVIDYAHTPDALEKVLQTLREVSMQDIVPSLSPFGMWDTDQEAVTELTGAPQGDNAPQGGNEFSNSRLICVFGCGGNRDAGKRPVMGAIAARLADVCIVTSDNPRNENPQAIIAAIVAGMDDVHKINPVAIIEDRAAAITQAIHSARAADTVLVAGKGHEDYQEINGIKYSFSDILIAQQALQSWSSRAQQVARP